MENAIWQSKNLIASDIANEFELEHKVRKAAKILGKMDQQEVQVRVSSYVR